MKKINKKAIIISIIIIFIIGIYYFFIRDKEYIESEFDYSVLNETDEKEKEDVSENKILDIEDREKIVIYITGAVKKEGIYELNENSRVADIIEKAGGLTDDANINDINLAYVLEDGMKVYIPKNSDKNEVKDDTNIYVSKENNNTSTSKNTNSDNQNNKININTATQTELETLPGIGPSIAVKIINYRKENGKFTNVEELKKVSGIGNAKYEQIKNLIRV